jgi:tetratricopeptide (TPR) repeat protein
MPSCLSSLDSPDTHACDPLEHGLALLRAQDYPQAVHALQAALRLEPGRFAAIRGLATAYLLDDRPGQARAVLERFTAEHPMAAEGWRLAAQLDWKLQDRPRSIEILRAGLKRLPHCRLLHRQLAVFLAADGKLQEAAEHQGAAPHAEDHAAGMPVAPPPPDRDWLDQIAADPVLLGAILTPLDAPALPLSDESQRMLEGIEVKLAGLLEVQPHHADRQLLLARLQAKLESLPAAMLSVQRALRANPQLVDAHRLKAELHGRMGETDQAIEVLRGLLKRGLSWPDLHYQIAALEQQRGRGADARSHLYSAVALNPRFDRARQLLERLAA